MLRAWPIIWLRTRSDLLLDEYINLSHARSVVSEPRMMTTAMVVLTSMCVCARVHSGTWGVAIGTRDPGTFDSADSLVYRASCGNTDLLYTAHSATTDIVRSVFYIIGNLEIMHD